MEVRLRWEGLIEGGTFVVAKALVGPKEKLNRKDYGINYHQFLKTGVVSGRRDTASENEPGKFPMTTLIGLSGSLRAGSFNTALLRAAAGLMPDGAQLIAKTIHGIPLYDGDVESASGIPAAVQHLGAAIANADGLLLATPEYNNSIPGPFKNAIDWLSRIEDGARPIFTGKRVAVIGASPGGFGTLLAQDAWLSVLRTLETQPWFGGRLLVSRATGIFDADGQLADEGTRKKLQEFLAGFVGYVQATS